MKVCRHCGQEKASQDFPISRKVSDGLSSWCRSCHSAAVTRSQRKARLAGKEYATHHRKPKEARVCESCGATFHTARGARYCGLLCSRREGMRRMYARNRAAGLRSDGQVRSEPNPIRLSTSIRVVTKHPLGLCPECQAWFLSERKRTFCSDRCAKIMGATAARHRLRAAVLASTERISRQVVFERDGWTCQLCGDAVDSRLSGRDEDGPTLDHIFPLSKGGEHTYANVQLAHKRCNTAKGSIIRGSGLDIPRKSVSLSPLSGMAS
jgi:hypothetical protein